VQQSVCHQVTVCFTGICITELRDLSASRVSTAAAAATITAFCPQGPPNTSQEPAVLSQHLPCIVNGNKARKRPPELLLVGALHHQPNINSTTCWPAKMTGLHTSCQHRRWLLQQAAPGTTPRPGTTTGQNQCNCTCTHHTCCSTS